MSEWVWPNLGYGDAPAAIRFLVNAFGFREAAVYPVDQRIAHAELRWPGGGGVMVHSAMADASSVADLVAATAGRRHPGFSIHIDTDEPDALFARAVAAGARVIREVEDSPVGTRGFIVADPEGLFWSFGTPLPRLVRDEQGQWRPAGENSR